MYYVEHCEKTDKHQVRWRDANKKKHRDKGYIWDTDREAQKRIKELERQRENNALGIYKEITLEDASVVFIKYVGPELKNEAQRTAMGTYWNQINNTNVSRYDENGKVILQFTMGKMALSKISYMHIADFWESFIRRGCKVSTANRSIMWIGNLYVRMSAWNKAVPEYLPEKVALPVDNPVQVARDTRLKNKRSEKPLERKRRLNRSEMKAMKDWCFTKCASLGEELWDAIRLAMLTTLRKSDLMKLKAGEVVQGIQGKTGRPFDLPLTPQKVVTITDAQRRKRWGWLRKDLGWLKKGTPLHTTWHDLRHCGPGLMASKGVSSKIIQEVLGHATQSQSKTYTQVFDHELAPAMQIMNQEIDTL